MSDVNSSLIDRQMYPEEPPIQEVWAPDLRQSTASTAFNITKCFVGAASFELPYAFMQGGTSQNVLWEICCRVM